MWCIPVINGYCNYSFQRDATKVAKHVSLFCDHCIKFIKFIVNIQINKNYSQIEFDLKTYALKFILRVNIVKPCYAFVHNYTRTCSTYARAVVSINAVHQLTDRILYRNY